MLSSATSASAAGRPARTFSARELSEARTALDELAVRGQTAEGKSLAGVELRRDDSFLFQGRRHSTVMGVYLPGSRTAVLYDAAFAGPAVVQPLAPPESVRTVLAAALLGKPGLRRRWLTAIRAPETAPPAAVILEAGAITRLLLDAEAGHGLALQKLGPESAFALGLCFSMTRPTWLKAYRPDLATFFATLLPPGWPAARLGSALFDPWATPIRC
jgi:hypothetical protein